MAKIKGQVTLVKDGEQGPKGDTGAAGENGKTLYGTSSATAGTSSKVVACSDAKNLYAGLTVCVKFSAGNTYATGALTLNVNNLGAKSVYINNVVTSATNQFLWAANATITFTYNGTGWVPVGEPRSYYGTSATAVGTAAKTTTIDAVVICKGATVSISSTNGNTAATTTLNVSSTGAKAVYNNGGRAAYWSPGASVSFTFNGQYWYISSDPIYASTATIGNAAGSNVYIDNDSVDIREGSDVLASFTKDDINIGLWKNAQIGDKKRLNFYGGNAYIECEVGDTRELVRIGGVADMMLLAQYISMESATGMSIDAGAGDIHLSSGLATSLPLIATLANLNNNLTALNADGEKAGAALKIIALNGQNLAYGCWSTGIYFYGGYQTAKGAPDDWAGVMITFKVASGIWVKVAFSADPKIYLARNYGSTDATWSGWREI